MVPSPSENEIRPEVGSKCELPRADYTTCKECGRHTDEVGPLSHVRLCAGCGVRLARQAALDLSEHRGHYFKRWRAGMAASVGAVLLDESRPGS